PAREPKGRVDADPEHQQVAERIEQVPEDEEQIGRANLSLAEHHCSQRAAHGCTPLACCVSSTKTSSRLAPVISTRRMRPALASEAISSSSRFSSSLSRSCTVLWTTFTSSTA